MISLRLIQRNFSKLARYQGLQKYLKDQLSEIKEAGTFKVERQITSPQSMQIVSEGKEVLNFCANNYLGLANNQEIINATKKTLDQYGFGMSSVRFICGTQDIHKKLEKSISKYFQTDDTILYSSCFDANAGIFEALLTQEDAVISDALNHASLIDGIRLSKAQRYRYNHLDMADLEKCLKESQSQKNRLIVTDGVFSMDGDIAPLDKIVKLAEKYNATILVDESHATGFMGENGIGVPDIFGVTKEIDIINGTMGKSLGGACGGFTTGRQEVIDILRQRSRPYLFSNSIAPPIVGASIKVFEELLKNPKFRQNLSKNVSLFRTSMKKAGFKIMGHDSCPIAPVYIGDAKLANQIAELMFKENIYVIGFSYPVVPKGQARIRVQLSAAHTEDQIKRTVAAFIKVGKQVKLI